MGAGPRKATHTLAGVRFLPLAALLLMAACGQQAAPTASAIDPTQTISPTVQTTSATPEPEATSPTSPLTASAPASTSPTVSARPAGLRGMLLLAGEIGDTWKVGRTGGESEATGRCQVTTLFTIGATSSLRRTFTSDTDTAVQVVAQFADSKSAWRSFEVLKSWRSKCASRVPAGSTISSLLTVNAAPGVGHRYRVVQPDGLSERVGLVRHGEYVSVIVFGQDGTLTYPTGQDPESLALKAIVPLLR